ncbi:MAG: hypothetical protein ABEH47_02155 [Haloferacaceae archaeon]
MTSDADDEPGLPVVCPECGTTSRVPVDEAAEAIERHNERLHDGEAVAEVDPAVADRIADLAARDLGLLDDE